MKPTYSSIPAEMFVITYSGEENYLHWRWGGGDTVEIFDIHVGGERRTGIGRKMVEALFRHLILHTPNIKTVYAITRTTNEVAQQFYEALRFRTCNPLRRFYASDLIGADALLYSRSPIGPV